MYVEQDMKKMKAGCNYESMAYEFNLFIGQIHGLKPPVEVKQKNHQLTEALSVKLNSTVINEDICFTANQCQSNATCYFNKTIQKYSCKCADGHKNCINKAAQNYNDKCKIKERLPESDPCSMNLCKNGTTCIVKVRKDMLKYECHNESRLDQQMLHDSDNEDNMTDVNNITNETIPTKRSLAAISLNDTAAGTTIDTNHIRLSTIGLLTSVVWFQYLYQMAT
ncbi:unnamed protein product [Wuchereria bancrofti]|uniref:EGF-like domain-containing protein n=1 Tax=Wuchereria bancrofti TaxID=6293 RepID=A0A3P7EIT0_WUCBA|nr:unnamed protein product [Wuchereria bancrofti]